MTTICPPYWRFEALHALAGMAFVSRVGAFGDGEDLVCFRPPSFQPEPISHSSLALGATHRNFQGGLVIDGVEVYFLSLAAAGEFVRRLYIRGFAGDGGGTPGANSRPEGPAPSPKGRGVDNSRPLMRDARPSSPALSILVNDMADFRKSVTQCKFGDAHPMAWNVPLISAAKANTGNILLSGATHVFFDSVAQWLSAPLDDLLPHILRFKGLLWAMTIDTSKFINYIEGLDQDYFNRLPFDIRSALMHVWPHQRLRFGTSDPLDVLSQLSAPIDFFEASGRNDMLAWLSVFLATPIATGVVPVGTSTTMYDRDAIERAVFAAAVIVNRRDVWPLWFDEGEQLEISRTLESKALAWLREHLPRMAYCSVIEALLASRGSKR